MQLFPSAIGPHRQYSVAVLLAGVSLIALATLAEAATAIGETTTVKNDVKGSRGGAAVSLGQGDDVFQSEIIRTGADSSARIELIDATSVSVAPSSQLTLDKFVYNGDHTAKSVTLNAVKGSFRFISGNSPSDAYKVNTPQAAIGVRGTVYDVQVVGGTTDVVLIEGSAKVCVKGTATCVLLAQSCQSVSLTKSGFSPPPAPGAKIWSFDGSCSSAVNQTRPDPQIRPDPPLGNGGATPSPPPPPPSQRYN